jgi:hypothetical protein
MPSPALAALSSFKTNVQLHLQNFWDWSATWRWLEAIFAIGFFGFVGFGEPVVGLFFLLLSGFSLFSRLLHSKNGPAVRAFGILFLLLGTTVIVAMTVAFVDDRPWSNLPVFWNKFIVRNKIPSNAMAKLPPCPPNYDVFPKTMFPIPVERKAKPVPQPSPPVIQAPYGNLSARCDDIGNSIIRFAEQRIKQQPQSQSQPQSPEYVQEYWDWYRTNDGMFHGYFFHYVSQLHDEMAGVHVDDPQLDRLIEEHERHFKDRQQHVQEAIDHPMLFHLSIEQIREIGERFRFVAPQIPH